jgi:hypothetical protein
MRLVIDYEGGNCLLASLAMLFDLSWDEVEKDLFSNLEYPFQPPWDSCAKVPDMNVVVDWALHKHNRSLVPFEYDPVCTPHQDCTPVKVWKDGHEKFLKVLNYWTGLIECETYAGKGHMVAWDGSHVYDPRVVVRYRFEELIKGFIPRRFWICT